MSVTDDDRGAPNAARAKRAARLRALAARDALPAAERARLSSVICTRATALPELVRAASVFLFASFRSEVDTSALLRWALERGVSVALPRIRGPRRMDAVRIEDPATDLVSGSWGIPEPRDGLPLFAPERIDVVVVPGAAFSLDGARCGYGGGFYDTYIPGLVSGTPRIALAFDMQIADELPCEPHDLRVDAIVTETRVIRPA